MFKQLHIAMSGPICTCEVQDLGWCPKQVGVLWTFEISCNICKTVLLVPHEKFRAIFTLDRQYPKGLKQTKPSVEDFEKKDAEADTFLKDVLGITLGEKRGAGDPQK